MNKTKRLIFESAIKIFSSSGYNGATMDDIALSAGVAKGTLYYHFNSKEEIFKFIITEGMIVINEEIQEATKNETNPICKLRALCKVELNMVYKNKDFFKVVMSQLWGQDSRQLELRNVIQEYIKCLEGYIKEAMNGGVIKKSNSSFMAYTLFGVLCSASIYELMNEAAKDIDEVCENLMQYILNGIAVNQIM